jgi:putative ABC transport system permease protein
MTSPGAGARRRFLRVRRGRREIRAEVDEELDFHLGMRERELVARGLAPAAAREEARRRFGDLETTREVCMASDERRERRRAWGESAVEAARDFVLAARLLRRRPLYAAVATATLALGIGATTAVWSAVDHVLLRPLPYREVERVVTLWETDAAAGRSKQEVAPGDYVDWRERSRSFTAMALAEPFGYDLTDGERPEPAAAWRVTEEWFEALGVALLHGRGFLPEEYAASAERPAAVVLSHRLWRSRYGADPGLVGRTVALDGAATVVVGVLPAGLDYPEPRDVWTPKVFLVTDRRDERTERGSRYMRVVARLAGGVGLAAAADEMDRIGAELAREAPSTNAGVGVAVVPLREHVVGRVRPALLVLLGAVALVLAIACANVAGLLLGRAWERGREVAVRVALGASRARLARQALAEGLALAAAGGALGVGAAWAALRLVVASAPPAVPRLGELGLDGPVLAFAAGVSLAAALLCAAAPALRPTAAGTPRGTAALLGGAGSATRTGTAPRLRTLLVVAQVAIGLVLLVGAGLLGRSFLNLTANDLGFTVERRAALQLFLWDHFPRRADREQAVAAIAERMAAVPGVGEVAVVSALPFHPSQIDAADELVVEGRPAAPGERRTVFTTVASPGYFGLMGIPLLAGRPPSERDRGDAPPVAWINETLARRFFPGEDPVGRRVTIGVMSAPVSREIAGVVGDVRPTALDSDPRPELYVPYAQTGTGSVTFVVRGETDPAALLDELRAAVWEVEPEQSVYHAATLEELVAATLAQRRFHLALVGAFSTAALALALVGVYGLLSYLTRQRTSEIGVRMALGASRRSVASMVVGSGLRLALAGVGLGLAGALAATRFLRPLLYGVEPADPRTFTQIALLVVAICALAAYLPARRAAAADPVAALRGE